MFNQFSEIIKKLQVFVRIIVHRCIVISLWRVRIFLLFAIHFEDASLSPLPFFPVGQQFQIFRMCIRTRRGGVPEQFGLLFFSLLFSHYFFYSVVCRELDLQPQQSLMMNSTVYGLTMQLKSLRFPGKNFHI